MIKKMIGIGLMAFLQMNTACGQSFYDWFEKGLKATDPDQKIEHLTNALKNWKGNVYQRDLATVYISRALAYTAKRKYAMAIEDCNQAIVALDRNDSNSYIHRDNVYFLQGLFRKFSKEIKMW